MYSLLMYFITSRVIDTVELGWDGARAAIIVSDNAQELADLIYSELGRAVTFLEGHGYVSDVHKDVIYCVITRAELFELQEIIAGVEGSSFATISEVSEIIGDHVKS